MLLLYRSIQYAWHFGHAHSTGKDGGCVFTATRTIMYIRNKVDS